MLLKKFAYGELSSLLHFNFVHDFINYLCATVTNAVTNFACGELSSLLYFNFAHELIIYLCTTVTIAAKKFRLLRDIVAPVFQFRSTFN